MFTGIVETQGRVVTVIPQDGDLSLKLDAQHLDADDMAIGESIAVNGVCLTVVRFSGTFVEFDVSGETLERTNLSSLRSGAKVNLERAMTLNDRYGGHLVSGHVDGVGELVTKQAAARSETMAFSAGRSIAAYIAEKGSITVDGVSLTVNKVRDLKDTIEFDVNIVPHTLEVTTLGKLEPGDCVHLEADLVARYLKRLRDCP